MHVCIHTLCNLYRNIYNGHMYLLNVKTQCHNFVQVSSESPIRQEKKSDGFRRRKKPRQHLHQVQPVDIGGDAFKMWSDVGLSLGLSSDPEIATFLLQQ